MDEAAGYVQGGWAEDVMLLDGVCLGLGDAIVGRQSFCLWYSLHVGRS